MKKRTVLLLIVAFAIVLILGAIAIRQGVTGSVITGSVVTESFLIDNLSNNSNLNNSDENGTNHNRQE